MLFNKFLGENEKCVFYFFLKNEGTFWPTQQLLFINNEDILADKFSSGYSFYNDSQVLLQCLLFHCFPGSLYFEF